MAAEATPPFVWDLPTRIFHWGLAAAIAGAWWTAERGSSEAHALFGYVVLALLLFRLGWGVFGADSARLAPLLRSPAAALSHLRHAVGREPLLEHRGHNPAGGYAVLLMLAVLIGQTVSGLFLYDDETFWGPLNGYVSEGVAKTLGTAHAVGANVLWGLIGLHLAAVAFYVAIRKADLLRPMLWRSGAGTSSRLLRRAGVIAAVAVLSVFLLARL